MIAVRPLSALKARSTITAAIPKGGQDDRKEQLERGGCRRGGQRGHACVRGVRRLVLLEKLPEPDQQEDEAACNYHGADRYTPVGQQHSAEETSGDGRDRGDQESAHGDLPHRGVIQSMRPLGERPEYFERPEGDEEDGEDLGGF
jgi:hypothetical protein